MTNIPRWPSAPAIRVAISDLDGNCEVDGRGRNAPLTYRTGAEGALIALMANMPSSRHTSPVAFLSTPTAAWVNRHRRRQQPGDACQDLPPGSARTSVPTLQPWPLEGDKWIISFRSVFPDITGNPKCLARKELSDFSQL